MSGGGKGRKIGRNERKPCQKRYTAAQRWVSNKAKKIAREERRKQLRLARDQRRERRRANRLERAA